MKKITLILRQGNDEKRDGISFLSCIWMRTTNEKVAHFVPLSCFHWHISCHFWSFDDITETPGSAWAITESDSSFPLCSFHSLSLCFIPFSLFSGSPLYISCNSFSDSIVSFTIRFNNLNKDKATFFSSLFLSKIISPT